MELSASERACHGTSHGASDSASHVPSFLTGDDLLEALATYEDLSLDLILDDSTDAVFEPPDVPTVSEATAPAQLSRTQKFKAEEMLLRDEIARLERELASVKAASRGPVSRAWKDVAKRQRARRAAAERENDCLRAKLLRQVQVARSLQVVLRHREDCDGDREAALPPDNSDAWMDDLGLVLRRFAADIECAYQAMPQVPAAERGPLTSQNRSVVKSHVMNGVEQLYVETTQTYVVPFTFSKVSAVAWRAFSSHYERQQRLCELYCQTDDMSVVKFSRPRSPDEPAPSDDRDWTVTAVVRNYCTSDGPHVIVWRGGIVPPSSTLRRAIATSTGWMEFVPHASDPNCSVADVCIRTVPRRGNLLLSLAQQRLVDLSTTSSEVRAFISQQLCTTAEDMMAVIEEIENMLLDEGRGDDGSE